MYSVSDIYNELSGAFAREYHLLFFCSHLVDGKYDQYATYTEKDGIISVKIVNGQTTGGFSIGGTSCASLEMTVTNGVPIKINDRIEMQVFFETPYATTAGSESLGLGIFYVDSMAANQQNTRITALDKMAQLAKNYNSALSYPSTVLEMFTEISQQSGTAIADDINIFNNVGISEKPVKGKDNNGDNMLFTRREVLGYLAGMNGGNAYIDKNGKINISVPIETGALIDSTRVVSQSLNDTSLEISDIVVDSGGTSQSISDNWTEGTVQLYCPLTSTSEMISNLKEQLVGLKYDSVVIKKQGTGVYQLGDVVSYRAADGTLYKMLIMGIVYDFSGGFFSETLYSLAKSESQRQYSGVQNISQNLATPSTGGGAPQTIDTLVSGDKEAFFQGSSCMLIFQDRDGKYFGDLRADGTNSNFGIFAQNKSIGFNGTTFICEDNKLSLTIGYGEISIQFKDGYKEIRIVSPDNGAAHIDFGGRKIWAGTDGSWRFENPGSLSSQNIEINSRSSDQESQIIFGGHAIRALPDGSWYLDNKKVT